MNIDTTQVSTNGDREKFIHDEVLMMVILGTLGRNPTYNERATDAQKEQFRKSSRDNSINLERNMNSVAWTKKNTWKI